MTNIRLDRSILRLEITRRKRKTLSLSELDALRLRHRISIVDEVEYIPEYVELFVVRIEHQAGPGDIPKNTNLMEVELVQSYSYTMLFEEFANSYSEFVLQTVRLKIQGKGK